MKTINKVIFGLVVLLISLPLLQYFTGFANLKPIAGYYKLSPAPSFENLNEKTWIEGAFQNEFASRAGDHLGFRQILYRIRNQCDLSCFGIVSTKGYIKGGKGYYFQEDYIREYTGEYFIGSDLIRKKLQKLRDVQDSLEAKGVHLLVVIEPGKASYYPELIPQRYLKYRQRETNYTLIAKLLADYQIHHLDLNKWFMQMKDSSVYPLFGPYGMHWSVYGEYLAADTLYRALEKQQGTPMPEIEITDIVKSDVLHETDYDIGIMLNLLWKLPRTSLFYPRAIVKREKADESKKMLVIADSYYKTLLTDLPWPLFVNSEYWWYNSKVYPFIDDFNDPVNVDKTNLVNRYGRYGTILLMSSEINLHSVFWKFMDEAYSAFHPGYYEPPIYNYVNSLLCDNVWFETTTGSVRKNKRPLRLQIHDDAEWIYRQEKNR